MFALGHRYLTPIKEPQKQDFCYLDKSAGFTVIDIVSSVDTINNERNSEQANHECAVQKAYCKYMCLKEFPLCNPDEGINQKCES